MKVRLLNDGGYNELSHIEFPVEVEGVLAARPQLVYVASEEFIRIGAKDWELDYGAFPFHTGTECELVTPTP